jgi:hypothetical protein
MSHSPVLVRADIIRPLLSRVNYSKCRPNRHPQATNGREPSHIAFTKADSQKPNPLHGLSGALKAGTGEIPEVEIDPEIIVDRRRVMRYEPVKKRVGEEI